MALVYLDASAALKLCVQEPGSRLAAAVWDGADAVATSRICDAEVRATLAAGHRAGLLDDDAHTRALRIWEELRPATYVVEVSTEVADLAAALVERHPLRGADALHLASALLLDTPDLMVAVWDEHLAAAARAERLVVLP